MNTFLSKFFFSSAQRRLFAKAVPIFTYHQVAEPPRSSRDPFLYVDPQAFARQMEKFESHGFTTGSLSDAVCERGNPQRKIVITFDDGYENVFRNALPVLARHHFSALQFIVSGRIGGQNEWDILKGNSPERLMDDIQIKEWVEAGNQIGSHSRKHPNLRKLDLVTARAEIFDSKKELEDRFGREVAYFCFPHGAFNETLCDLVQEAGYKAATTVRFGINPPGVSPYALSRIVPLSPLSILKKARHRFLATS